MSAGKSKIIYKIALWVMICGILINTIGRYVPLYFVDPKIADFFGQIVFILTLVSIAVTTFRAYYIHQEDNWRSSAFVSMFVTFIAYITLSIITFLYGFAIITDVTVLYVNRDDPTDKIIEQYVDLGALGDGHKIVLRKDLTPLFKYEKLIDTNTIVKTEWIKLSTNINDSQNTDPIFHQLDMMNRSKKKNHSYTSMLWPQQR